MFGFGELAGGETLFPVVGAHVGIDDDDAVVPEFDFHSLHEDADSIPLSGFFDGIFFGWIDAVKGAGSLSKTEAGSVDGLPAVGVVDDLDFQSAVGGIRGDFFDAKKNAAVSGFGDFPLTGEFKVAVFLFGDEVIAVLAGAKDAAIADFPGRRDDVHLIAAPMLEG